MRGIDDVGGAEAQAFSSKTGEVEFNYYTGWSCFQLHAWLELR